MEQSVVVLPIRTVATAMPSRLYTTCSAPSGCLRVAWVARCSRGDPGGRWTPALCRELHVFPRAYWYPNMRDYPRSSADIFRSRHGLRATVNPWERARSSVDTFGGLWWTPGCISPASFAFPPAAAPVFLTPPARAVRHQKGLF